MNKTMKKEQTLQFIELYKKNEILWNMNLTAYRRNDLKLKAYEGIGAEMYMTVEEVRKKIKALRTTYMAERHKVESSKKSGSGTESLYQPNLFWYSEMSFLNPSIVLRKSHDNTDKETPKSTEELQEAQSEFNGKNSALLQPMLFEDSQPNVSTVSKSTKRKRTEEPISKFDSAVNKLLEINQAITNVYENFSENIGTQLSSFPEDEAYNLMADIQTLVSKRKIEMIRNAQSASKSTSTLSEPIALQSTSALESDYLEAEYLEDELNL